MKKLLCILLAILLIPTTLTFVGCSEDKTAKCVHEYILCSSTATCTKTGTETYKCLYCEKTTTKEITNPSHAYKKNKCSTCGDTIIDIKNLSTAQKKDLYEKLEDTAPFIYDDEAMSASQDLYLLCENDVEYYEKKVETAKQAVSAAYSQRPIRVFNAETGQWEYQLDKRVIKEAEDNLAYYENLLEEEKELFELSKLSYALTCEGYAWYLAIYHIKNSSSISNQFLKEKLVYLITLYVLVTDSPTTYSPAWYGDITTAINTIIGIDITK